MIKLIAAATLSLLCYSGCSSSASQPLSPSTTSSDMLDVTPFSFLSAHDILRKLEDWYLNAKTIKIESLSPTDDGPDRLLGQLSIKGDNKFTLLIQRKYTDSWSLLSQLTLDGQQLYYRMKSHDTSTDIPSNIRTGTRITTFRLGVSVGYIVLTNVYPSSNFDFKEALDVRDVTMEKDTDGLSRISYEIVSSPFIGNYSVTLWFDPRTSKLSRRTVICNTMDQKGFTVNENYKECNVNIDIDDKSFAPPTKLK